MHITPEDSETHNSHSLSAQEDVKMCVYYFLRRTNVDGCFVLEASNLANAIWNNAAGTTMPCGQAHQSE